MVAHWKSHVKQQQLQKRSGAAPVAEKHGKAAAKQPPPVVSGGRGRGRGRPAGRPPAPAKTHTTSRGRPITSKQAGRKARKDKKAKKAQRKDKGRPRWTAYLLWSTRRRKEIRVCKTLANSLFAHSKFLENV
jgi:hypothetical protein